VASALDRRRAAKAARRKAVVAAKRKTEGTSVSFTERVRRAAAGSIDCCVLHAVLFEQGNGTLILARTAADGDLLMAAFLLDVFCLGVKDVTLQSVDRSTLDLYVKAMDSTSPMIEVDPAYARKLVRAAVAYAQSIGFDPPREYEAAERLFGDISAEVCLDEFTFGHNGKPLYVPGPSETAGQIGRRVQQLYRRLGDGGFDLAMAVEEDEDMVTDDRDDPSRAGPQIEAPERGDLARLSAPESR
jgi:hypothetical protein